MNETIMVTGGAGFIGANFVLRWLATEACGVINLDSLTYAGNLLNLESLRGDARHSFVHGDIKDSDLVRSLLRIHRPRAIVHFAAETHVDRSIVKPEEFIQTNITGTFQLLEAAHEHWEQLAGIDRDKFVFLDRRLTWIARSSNPKNSFKQTSPELSSCSKPLMNIGNSLRASIATSLSSCTFRAMKCTDLCAPMRSLFGRPHPTRRIART